MVTIFQYIGTNAGYMSGLFTIHATKGGKHGDTIRTPRTGGEAFIHLSGTRGL